MTTTQLTTVTGTHFYRENPLNFFFFLYYYPPGIKDFLAKKQATLVSPLFFPFFLF